MKAAHARAQQEDVSNKDTQTQPSSPVLHRRTTGWNGSYSAAARSVHSRDCRDHTVCHVSPPVPAALSEQAPAAPPRVGTAAPLTMVRIPSSPRSAHTSGQQVSHRAE